MTATAIEVRPEQDGWRLDRLLSEQLIDWSRSALQRHVDEGAVTVDGQVPTRGSKTRVRAGQIVRHQPPLPEPPTWDPEPMDLRILYEDEDVLALDKDAGRVVHPSLGHRRGTLLHGIAHHLGKLPEGGDADRPGIVHRLDRDTTGAIVVAKNEHAHRRLAQAFSDRRVEKRYVAVVLGTPRPEASEIRTTYGRDPRDRKKFSSKVARGKEAVTRYRVQRSHRIASELSINLETGRTHQIRVHMADSGHPLMGDGTYGGRRWIRFRQHQPDLDFGRPALHAARLVFPHPRSGDRIEVEAPLPPDMVDLLHRLETHDAGERRR